MNKNDFIFFFFFGYRTSPGVSIAIGLPFFANNTTQEAFLLYMCGLGVVEGKAVLYASWARDNTWRRHHIQLVSRELALRCVPSSHGVEPAGKLGEKRSNTFLLSLGGSLSLSFIDIYEEEEERWSGRDRYIREI